ncbi:MAG: cysteine--tRNA ligase [bacterium TMED198]|nr:MAG: cysteine--tRNA ligase [bacterium TMED198]
MTLFIKNTLSGKREEFVPIDPDNVRVYACGPTVYNYAHIGNARPAVICDLLVSVLRLLYPNVTYVSNITDIDDKIIKASNESGVPILDLTRKFEEIYNKDMSMLGVVGPDIQPRATEHIDEMISLVKRLIENGSAYEADSHVLFHVPSYSSYGMLSKRDISDQVAGSRVEVESYKKDPSDFVLWKPSTKDQPGWDSPWGFGRPGWHLECSVMSEKSLKIPFDLHAGGQDLIFPHHENEIAQSCGSIKSNDPSSFSKYWMHNAMIRMDDEKMSKSIGNILYVHDLIKKFPGEVLRLTLLSAHYRQPLNWTHETIQQSRKTLDRMYRVLKKAESFKVFEVSPPDDFMSALCDDLNTSKAMAVINSLVSSLSKAKGEDAAQFKSLLLSSAGVLGILKKSPDEWLGYSESDAADNEEIQRMIDARDRARNEKDFSLADELRDKLDEMGVEIEDSPEGTKWRKRQ